jgi:hypothetical protein
VHQWRAALAGADVQMPDEIRHALDEVAVQAAQVGHDGLYGSDSP